MIEAKDRRNLVFFAFVLLAFSMLPTLIGYLVVKPGVFTGFWRNPLDGLSYYSKMQIGLNGGWKFHLAYSPEIGSGAYLYLYYILLGHIARLTELSIPSVFHLSQALNICILVVALYGFYKQFFRDSVHLWHAMIWAGFGMGMGWVLLPFGTITADLWVSEAYPFLSSATSNSHFTLGIAIQLILLTFSPIEEKQKFRNDLIMAFLSLLLAAVSSFSVPVVLLVLIVELVWQWILKEDRKKLLRRLFVVGLGGGPYLVYAYLAQQVDPVLAGWNAQNFTPSPPWWDVVLSFSPALMLAGFVVIKRLHQAPRTLIVWMVVCLILINIPFTLQRRFFVGYAIPLVGLAVWVLVDRWPENWKRYWTRFFALTLPTLLLLEFAPVVGMITRPPEMVFSSSEAAGLSWLEENADSSLVLASPTMGAFIPAFSNTRVLYGHPFESIHSEDREAALIEYFSSSNADQNLLDEYPFDYLFYGPREKAFGELTGLDHYVPVFHQGDVTIYALNNP